MEINQTIQQLTRQLQREKAVAKIIDKIRNVPLAEREIQFYHCRPVFLETVKEMRSLLAVDRVGIYCFNNPTFAENVFESVVGDWPATIVPDLHLVWQEAPYSYCNTNYCAISDIFNVTLPERHQELLEQYHITAYCLVPVFLGENLWGLLVACHHRSYREWEEEEIELLTRLGSQIGATLQQIELLVQTKYQARQLQETLADLSAIVDNLADGLLVTDIQGRITRYNPALLAMFDLQRGSLLGQPLGTLFPIALADLVKGVDREVETAEVQLNKGRVGQAIATSIFKSAEGDEFDQCLGSVILIRDVTMEKEVDRMKTDFIATVSHELRTPLTSVLGFASIIKEKLEEVIFPVLPQDNPKLKKVVKRVGENIGIIVDEAERLTALINSVLDIAKMEAGQVEWKLEVIDFQEIIERAIAATSSLFVQKNLKLVRQIEGDLPLIKGDNDRLIQVMINLISNAVKFTESGTITCRVLHRQKELQIEVKDTGLGIAPEYHQKIFERFKQVGNILTDKPKGTGLGLPICKQIIEHHGGKIWVESEPGEGSTFAFTLPLSQEQPEPLPVNVNEILEQLKEKVVAVTPGSGRDRQVILIVDDEANIRELLRQTLEAEGYIIREARDGMDGIKMAQTLQPNLIILDVMMPHINGFDVAAVLKNNPATMKIPIIILSLMEDRERGYRLGVDRYFTKPIDLNFLLQEIDYLLVQAVSQKKVLVVDQNPATLRTLSDALQAQGYNVIKASDSEEGLHKALADQPDMIIIDSHLPQNSHLVKTVRSIDGLEDVSLIFLGDLNPKN